MDDQQPTRRRFQFRLPFIFLMTAMVALTFAGYRISRASPDDDFLLTIMRFIGSATDLLPMALVGIVMAAGRDGAQRWAGVTIIVSVAPMLAVRAAASQITPDCITQPDIVTYSNAIWRLGAPLSALVGACVATTRMLWVRVSVTWIVIGAIAFLFLGLNATDFIDDLFI